MQTPTIDALTRGDCTPEEALGMLAPGARLDLLGLPPGAAARFLTRAAERTGPMVVLTGDAEQARRLATNLRFFLSASSAASSAAGQVLHFAALDTTPYVEVAPDRRTAMDRLAVLFHLASEMPWRFVVAPVAAALRRVAPRETVRARSVVVRAETEVEREDLIDALVAGGYLRVPIAEDPGTFAVRGAVVDVYPPHARYPARIEFDDWLVTSIKRFDPDDQRTIETVSEVFVHPARDMVLTEATRERALARVRDLYDEANVPTKQTRQLLGELESGRAFYGIDALLPAFHDRLETLLDYAPAAPVVLFDPPDVARAANVELTRATEDREAKIEGGGAAYALARLYADEDELARAVASRTRVLLHRTMPLDSGGRDALERLGRAPEGSVRDLGARDHAPLVAELRARRSVGGDDTLQPVAEQVAGWLDVGTRVVLTARTRAQADRLLSLLRGYEVPVEKKPAESLESALASSARTHAHVVVGGLEDGFEWPAEGVVVVTEGEIFGTRTRRKSTRRRSRKARSAKGALEDLRQLQVGDYVVHADHGIGKYLGIERKEMAQTALERLRGDAPRVVEALIVEYHGKDKLFVPMTRLGLIQKFSGKEGSAPKLDRLGGTTFAKKKQKVRKAVAKLADDLLELYAERAAARRPALPAPGRTYAEFEATFPFEETRDQARAIEEVLGDLETGRPMDRLVCGDVGFGKTEVAMRATFRHAMEGRQVAILCPTTVLAQQHYQSFRDRLEPYPLSVGQLSRFVDKETSTDVLKRLKEGTLDVVVGTHRLLSKDVHFADLGLLVVDEEQRFGVGHKERIKTLKKDVDVLTLSATPIPRTLQLAIGGLRDLSLIATAPVDRRAVRTFACRWDDHTIKEAIGRELQRGGQVFFVYNRIDGLYERAARLQQLLPQARFVVAHGQMKEGELERAMTDFVAGEYDVLCSTAIIESGLDIPRANTMIVDRADMFGLAQLYQLRGRVGRSRERAYCYLVTPPPAKMTDEARMRIAALERFTELGSGFQVASLDMELRGVGDLLGAEQSGSVALVGFDLFVKMLEEAVAHLRGETVIEEIDPEVSVDVDHHLPETYIDDVGVRLSFYKRFATAPDEGSIQDLAEEMEDRFGAPPEPARQLVRVMQLRPRLRHFRALGCEASARRVTLHLREDTPLDPRQLVPLVRQPKSPWKLSPDMKLTYRWEDEGDVDAVERVEELLRTLVPLQKP